MESKRTKLTESPSPHRTRRLTREIVFAAALTAAAAYVFLSARQSSSGQTASAGAASSTIPSTTE